MIGLTEITDRDLYGSQLPWWQGVAYRRPELRSTVVAPIPLNWIIGKIRDWYWRILQGSTSQIDDKIQTALNAQSSEINEQRRKDRSSDEARGYERGYEACSAHWDKVFADALRAEEELG